MIAPLHPDMWTFGDLHPGQALGSIESRLDQRKLELWKSIYGDADHERGVPAGLLVAVMMDAYIKGIQPRPPGNVHAGQKVEFTGHQVSLDALLRVDLTCLAKRRAKDRHWVTFGASIREGSTPVMSGEILTVWAA